MLEKNLKYLVMQDPWKVPFLGRQRVDEKRAVLDAPNGCYPNATDENAEYMLNLQAKIDENGCIQSIRYYKTRDLSCGAGRPQTKELELSAKDRKKFSEILTDATVSRAEQELPDLLEKAIRQGLSNQWHIVKINKNSVIFESPDKEKVTVAKNQIEVALEISHTYIEVLTSRDFWDANDAMLKKENREPILALLSLVDISDYAQKDVLLEASKNRAHQILLESGYKELCKAVSDNDLRSARKYQEFADFSCPSSCIPPLYTAVKNKNISIVKVLLKNGAYVGEWFYLDGGLTSALNAVVEDEWDEVFKLFIKKPIHKAFQEMVIKTAERHNRPDYVHSLLKSGCTFTADQDTLSLGAIELAAFAKYPGIIWHPEHMDAVYQTGNLTAVRQMLASMQSPGPHYQFALDKKSVAEYQSKAVEWVIKTENIGLMKFCSSRGYSIESLSFSSWEILTLLPVGWARLVSVVFRDHAAFHRDVQRTLYTFLRQKKSKICKKLIIQYGAKMDLKAASELENDESIFLLFLDNFPFKAEMDRIFNSCDAGNDRMPFQLAIKKIVTEGSQKVCLHLLDIAPEILGNLSLTYELMTACSCRMVEDDVKKILHEKIDAATQKRAADWIGGNDNMISSYELQKFTEIILAEGKIDTDWFASILYHLRAFETNRNLWAEYIESFSKIFWQMDASYTRVPRTIKLSNDRVLGELKHIYKHAEEYANCPDSLQNFSAGKIIKALDAAGILKK